MHRNGRARGEQESTERLRVVVVDADPLARRQIVETLRAAGVAVVADTGDGHEAVQLARFYRPDVLVTELWLPRLDGLELIRRLQTEAPEVRSVVLSIDPDDDAALRALRTGACGVLSKLIEPAGLARALAAVHAGEAAVSRQLAGRLVEHLRAVPEAGRGMRPIRSSLTAREWEVLDLAAGGATPRTIADRLILSEETVASHIKSIRRKLGVRSRAEAVQVAQKLLAAAA